MIIIRINKGPQTILQAKKKISLELLPKVLARHGNGTRDIRVSKSVSRCRHYSFSRANARGGLSTCRAGEYSGFMTDGDDVYDISPLKKAEKVSEEQQRSLTYHLIRKTRGQIERKYFSFLPEPEIRLSSRREATGSSLHCTNKHTDTWPTVPYCYTA